MYKNVNRCAKIWSPWRWVLNNFIRILRCSFLVGRERGVGSSISIIQCKLEFGKKKKKVIIVKVFLFTSQHWLFIHNIKVLVDGFSRHISCWTSCAVEHNKLFGISLWFQSFVLLLCIMESFLLTQEEKEKLQKEILSLKAEVNFVVLISLLVTFGINYLFI